MTIQLNMKPAVAHFSASRILYFCSAQRQAFMIDSKDYCKKKKKGIQQQQKEQWHHIWENERKKWQKRSLSHVNNMTKYHIVRFESTTDKCAQIPRSCE